MARELKAGSDEHQMLTGIVQAAVDTVPGAMYGGLSQVQRGGQVTARIPSHEVVRKCDELQTELHEGPCLDAIWHQQTITIDDMASEDRWPKFADQAAALGIGSMIGFQLYVGESNLGALNLYSGFGVRFDADARLVGELFASHAAIALSGAREYRQMSEALASRDVIGQAKGLLMSRQQVTAQQAFTMLVRASQDANIKLNEIARWLVDEHERPGQAERPKGR